MSTSPRHHTLSFEIRDLHLLLVSQPPERMPPAEVEDCARRLEEVRKRLRHRRTAYEADFETVRNVAERVRAALRAKKLRARPGERAYASPTRSQAGPR